MRADFSKNVGSGPAPKPKVIVIVGATGTKKSFLAMQIARFLSYRAQIVSADAFQVYREMNVGTNKPSGAELKEVRHHFVDHISVAEDWNIKLFKEQAEKVIADLVGQKIVPIVCGGSGFYVDALVKNYNLQSPPRRGPAPFAAFTNQQLYGFLSEIDPEEAARITVGNRKRLVRAVDLYVRTGKTKEELKQNQVPGYETLQILCHVGDRQRLYEDLNERTKEMVLSGWLREVEGLLRRFPGFPGTQAAKATGYGHMVDCLLNYKEVDVAELQKQARNLAKRQITWCNKYCKDSDVVYDYSKDDWKDVASKVSEFIRG